MSEVSGASLLALLLLSTLAVLLAAALARRGIGPSRAADRWTGTAATLLGLVGLWLAASGVASPPHLRPSLERLLVVALAGLPTWAAVGRRTEQRTVVFLGLSVAVFAVSPSLAGGSAFNTSPADLAWGVLTLLTVAFATTTLLSRRPPLWLPFAVAAAGIAAAQTAHIVAPPPAGSDAPWLTIATLLAAPLNTVGAVAALIRDPIAPPAPAPQAEARPVPALHAFLGLSLAREASGFAAALTEAVGDALGADLCLLLTPPEHDGGITIGAGYDASRQAPVDPVRLDADGCPVFSQSMTLGRSVMLPAGTHAPDAATILLAAGQSGRSPAMLIPLPADGRTVAGLALLLPRAGREWSEPARLSLEAIAPALGEALAERMLRGAAAPADETSRTALFQAQRRIAELQAQLAAAPSDELVGIGDLRDQLDEAQRVIEVLESEIQRMRRAADATDSISETDAERLQGELSLALAALAEARLAASAASSAGASVPPTPARLVASLQEARQPLTAIAGYTDLLLGESIGLLGSTQRRFLERIRGAVRRMDSELSGMATAVARPPASSGGQSDLAGLIETALESIHDVLRARQQAVRLDLPRGPIPVQGEPAALRAVLARLFDDAASATPAGQEIRVGVLPESDDGVVVVTIGETSKGSRRTAPTPDLAEIQAQAEAFGGRLWVDPDGRGGLRFSLLLPSGGPA